MNFPGSPVPPSPMSFGLSGVRRGFIAVQPLALGIFVYGATFGLLAIGAGLSSLQAVAMSMTIYSGTAQTVTVNAMSNGSALAATALSVLLLNARYLFYGASLRPWLSDIGGARAYGSLFLLGDANWLMVMRRFEGGERDAGFVLGTGLGLYVAWALGTATAGVLGQVIPRPDRLGLDFLLVAFCAAMIVETVRIRPDRATVAACGGALAASLLVERLAPPGWSVVAAGLAGIAAAWAATPAGGDGER